MAKSSKPSCNTNKFHIEVTGINHNYKKEQHFDIYNKTNMKQQFSLEKTKKEDIIENDDFRTVYSWELDNKDEDYNIWLNIPNKDDNNSIKLPLFEKVTSYEINRNKVKYSLQSIIPMTEIKNIALKLSDQSKIPYKKSEITPLRSGFVYVFYKGKAWRELAVSVTDDGMPIFKDVNLYAYRKGKGKAFIKGNDKRETTGVPLDEIWIPQRENNTESDVYITFSEFQWSVERLNFFERDISNIKNRMIHFVGEKCEIVDHLPKMRYRNENDELKLSDPIILNRDLTGNSLLDILKQGRKAQKEYNEKGDYTKDVNFRFEYNAKLSALSENVHNSIKNTNIDKKEGQDIDSSIKYNATYTTKESLDISNKIVDDSINTMSDFSKMDIDVEQSWIVESTEDYLKIPKEKHVRYFLIDDPMFNLRHELSVLTGAQKYLDLLQADASLQPNFKSAQLLQNLILPKKIAGKKNPVNKFKDEMDLQPYGVFNKTLRGNLRKEVREDIIELQNIILDSMTDKKFVHCLRDIISLNDCNYRSAYKIVNICQNSILLHPDDQDGLLPDYLKKSDNYLLNRIKKMYLRDSNSLLRTTLFGTEEQQVKYDLLAENVENLKQYLDDLDDTNDGSGIMIPEHLYSIAKDNMFLKSIDDVVLPESLSSMADNSISTSDSVGQARRIMGLLNEMFGSYFTVMLNDNLARIKEINEIQIKNRALIESEVRLAKKEKIVTEMELEINKVIQRAEMNKFVFDLIAAHKLSGGSYLSGMKIIPTNKANPTHDILLLSVGGLNQNGEVELWGQRDKSSNDNLLTQTRKTRGGGSYETPNNAVTVSSENGVFGATKAKNGYSTIPNQQQKSISDAYMMFIDENESPEIAQMAKKFPREKRELATLFSESIEKNKELVSVRNEHNANELGRDSLTKETNKLTKYTAYNKMGIPIAFLYFEGWNLYSAMNKVLSKYYLGYKPSLLDTANLISAFGDTSVALIQVKNIITNKESTALWNVAETKIGKRLSSVLGLPLENKVAVSAGNFLNYRIGGTITGLGLIATGFGLLTGGIMIYQGIGMIIDGDKDGGLVTILAGITVMFGVVTSMFVTSSSFLGFPIIGWVIFAITSIACLSTIFFIDTDLEKWIKNSVFGKGDSRDSDYDFLRKIPSEAYKQLLSMIINVDLIFDCVNPKKRLYSEPGNKVGFCNDDIENIEKKISSKDREVAKECGATHIIKLKTNALNFFKIPHKKIEYSQKFQYVEITRISGSGGLKTTAGSVRDITPFETREVEDGLLYLFKCEFSTKENEFGKSWGKSYHAMINALAQIKVENMIFPQPSLSNYNDTQKYINDKKIEKTKVTFAQGQESGSLQNMLGISSTPKNPYWAELREF